MKQPKAGDHGIGNSRNVLISFVSLTLELELKKREC